MPVTYQYCHVCDYCIPRTHVHGGYRYWSSCRYASAASTDTSSFNITDTQTYLYCQVAIINHHVQHHRHNLIAKLAVFIDANVIITDAPIYVHYLVSGIIDAGDNITDMLT